MKTSSAISVEMLLIQQTNLAQVDQLKPEQVGTQVPAGDSLGERWQQAYAQLPNDRYRQNVLQVAIHEQRQTGFIEKKLTMRMGMHLLLVMFMVTVIIFLSEQLLGNLGATFNSIWKEYEVNSDSWGALISDVFLWFLSWPIWVRYYLPLTVLILTIALWCTSKTRWRHRLRSWVPFYARCYEQLQMSRWLRLAAEGIEAEVPVIDVVTCSSRFLDDPVTRRIPALFTEDQVQVGNETRLHRYSESLERLMTPEGSLVTPEMRQVQTPRQLAAMLRSDADLLEQQVGIRQRKIALYLEPLLLLLFAGTIVFVFFCLREQMKGVFDLLGYLSYQMNWPTQSGVWS